MNRISQTLLCLMSFSASMFAQQAGPLCLTSAIATPATGANANGTVTVNWEGGTPPYIVNIGGTIQAPTQKTTATQGGFLADADVTATVTDSSNPAVTVTATVEVGSDAVQNINLSLSQTGAGCGLDTGSITVTILGGNPSPNFTYTLTPPAGAGAPSIITSASRTVTFSDLAPNTYAVSVTDNAAAPNTGTAEGSIAVCSLPGLTPADTNNAILAFIIEKFCHGCLLTTAEVA